MTSLSRVERELVAIGASVASNCIPCLAYHVAKARKLGLSEEQIAEAVAFADKVRQVPAAAVLEAARRPDEMTSGAASGCGCGTNQTE
ncbi:MAG TPA: carboxymuconolactone decarboxylase family protein [Rhodocyclaceae bacterium]